MGRRKPSHSFLPSKERKPPPYRGAWAAGFMRRAERSNRRMQMTNRWLMGAAAAALTVAGAISAQAADLPTRKAPPVFVPPPFTWTGFYVGVNGGGVWSTGTRSVTLYDPNFPFLSSLFPRQPRNEPQRVASRRPGRLQLADRRVRGRSGNRLRLDGPEQELHFCELPVPGHFNVNGVVFPRYSRRTLAGRPVVCERQGEPGLARNDASRASASSPRRTTA